MHITRTNHILKCLRTFVKSRLIKKWKLFEYQFNMAFLQNLVKICISLLSFLFYHLYIWFFRNIYINTILTLQLSPHAGQSDQHGGWAAESKSRWHWLWKKFWSRSLAYKSTLEKQYFIVFEPKREVISSKIDRMAAI